MAMSKGMAHAHGHSHGGLGHGGHHSIHEGGVHVKVGGHTHDHMHNSHNKKHSGGTERMHDHGGMFPQGIQ